MAKASQKRRAQTAWTTSKEPPTTPEPIRISFDENDDVICYDEKGNRVPLPDGPVKSNWNLTAEQRAFLSGQKELKPSARQLQVKHDQGYLNERFDEQRERRRQERFNELTSAMPEKPIEAQAKGLVERVESLERRLKEPPKLPTQREKIRKQRNDFSCKRRTQNSPKTWQKIYDAYHKQFPKDKDASPATLRLSHDRNCQKCRTA